MTNNSSNQTTDIGGFLTGRTLYIDKPLGWTSFDVVNKVRNALRKALGIKKIKVGHAGTLDPLATGIVVVCTGKATKSIDSLMGHDKEYVATLQLGATTPSFDLETQVDQSFPTSHITRELIDKTLANNFTGEILQVPPTFSAISINGKRAYEYARKGKAEQIELKSRPVVIHHIETINFDRDNMTLDLRILCSKGTYIRSLARDIGLALNSGAHLTRLRRTKVGDVDIQQALDIQHVIDLIDNISEQQQQFVSQLTKA